MSLSHSIRITTSISTIKQLSSVLMFLFVFGLDRLNRKKNWRRFPRQRRAPEQSPQIKGFYQNFSGKFSFGKLFPSPKINSKQLCFSLILQVFTVVLIVTFTVIVTATVFYTLGIKSD